MKRLLFSFVICSVLFSALTSCNEQGKEKGYQAGEGWEMVWADEFKGDEIDEKNWTLQVLDAGHFNDEWQRYTTSSKNAFIEDECLVIKALHEGDEHAMGQYTSARVHSGNKQAWKYGKIVARIKLPYGQGIWPAFWMLGANISEIGGDTPWPQSGEVDILELYGTRDNGVVEGNLHYADKDEKHAMTGPVPYKLEQGDFSDDFHIFELEWNENKMVWYVDGEAFSTELITADEMSEFHKEFYILFNLAIGSLYAGRPDASTVFPQYMYIDWVRVYQK